jgi:hypothetical protein
MYGRISSSVGKVTIVSTFDRLLEFCSNRCVQRCQLQIGIHSKETHLELDRERRRKLLERKLFRRALKHPISRTPSSAHRAALTIPFEAALHRLQVYALPLSVSFAVYLPTKHQLTLTAAGQPDLPTETLAECQRLGR